MIEPRAIRHVDAFTLRPLEGNPAAVVDGDGLTTETMQRIALNQHLSETVFILPPASKENHAHIRIFTPNTELPFAGHPTIAASHILVSEGHVALRPDDTVLRLETGAGVIPVEVTGEPDARTYTMTQAAPEFRPCSVPRETIAAGVGLAPGDVVLGEDVATGLFWRIAQLSSLDAMRRVRPDYAVLSTIPHGVAIFCIGADGEKADVHVRAFAPDAGVNEDPVTGSANGCIAALIGKHQLLPAHDGAITYVAEQGGEMGQPGRVYARVTGSPDALTVQIGGNAVTVLQGDLFLE
jgi:PhzF family phenazine biosynthesis protein